MSTHKLYAFLEDLKTAEFFTIHKNTEQHKELLSKIEVIEWILEK